MEIDTLRKLYIHELKDLYSAETQLTRALPKMAKKAQSPDLRAAFEEHLEVTRSQIERLDEIFDRLGTRARGHKCVAMEGLIEEAQDLMSEDIEEDVLDAGLIAAAQKVEHYEIAGYGTVRTYAEMLGLDEDARLLQETADEEGDADKMLTQLATSLINIEAMNPENEEAEAAGTGGSRGRSMARRSRGRR